MQPGAAMFAYDIRARFMLAREPEAAFLYYAPIDRAHFDLALVWLLVCEHAEALGQTARVCITHNGRTVTVSDPPLTRAERARSDEAHARTVAEAIVMLAG
jgi:hypothetical protein